jgi:hypothetical protein
LCTALGADLEVRIRWHGEALDRLLDAAHAALVERTVQLLVACGWEIAIEVSFNHFGERGSVDVLAWHPGRRMLLIVEVKSVIPDAQSLLAAHDRKVRLAAVVGESRGWWPATVSRLLVVGDSSTTRQRVAQLGAVFGGTYPVRGAKLRKWLHDPVGSAAGLLFLRNSPRAGATNPVAGRQRVRRRQAGTNHG